ncbi:hypothetical protein Acr_00g0086030 [Actinidia rufa]|uniref:Reverse transcriptase zinc-binding domain-containing protein n=1 Tax=Actinidia rufa TaxID=165716 RepID=A0A7J0DVY2_9ERIC|nr:hypothetical protein Acr_00g0086030 [Actinidia rufa]
MYHFLTQDSDTEDTIFDLIWKNVAPSKVRCFGWLVYLGRVKTGELLVRWGIIQAGDESKLGITVKRNGFVPMVEKLEIQGYKKANLGMLAVGGYLDCLAY